MRTTKVLRKMCQGQRGFTLIELLVVILILGILAAVAVPFLAGFIEGGEEKAMATEMGIVQTAAAAAVVGGNGTAVRIPLEGDVHVVIQATPGTGGKNTVGFYLLEDTTYTYMVTELGVVTQEP